MTSYEQMVIADLERRLNLAEAGHLTLDEAVLKADYKRRELALETTRDNERNQYNRLYAKYADNHYKMYEAHKQYDQERLKVSALEQANQVIERKLAQYQLANARMAEKLRELGVETRELEI